MTILYFTLLALNFATKALHQPFLSIHFGQEVAVPKQAFLPTWFVRNVNHFYHFYS